MIISPSATLSCGTMSSGSEWEPSSRSFTMRTSSSVHERPAEPALSGRSNGRRNVFQKDSVVPYPLKMFGVSSFIYFSHALFSNGAPMVTMPRSADRSCGVRSCVRASMAMMVGTPIRNEMLYFAAYSRQRFGAKSRRMTTSPPA